MGRSLAVLAFATLLRLPAAAQSPSTAPSPARLRPEWLAGEAARSVTSDGRWIFPPPPYETLSPERVRAVLVGQRTPHTTPVPSDPPALPCGPLYYVKSVYEPFPRTADSVAQIGFGPHYVVPECSGDGSVVRVMELADAIDRVWGHEADGKAIVGPDAEWRRPSQFAEDGLPVTPERATAFVVGLTHARVDRVPDALAYLAGPEYVQNTPTCMRWHLHLDRSVKLRTASGAHRVTRDVWVNRALPCYRGPITLYVPIEPQPVTIDLPYPRLPESGGPLGPRPKARVARSAFFEAASVELR